MIGETRYLDALERHFGDALKAWESSPTNTTKRRLRQLEARIGIHVIAGQKGAAKSESEQARASLEAQLAQQAPEDRTALTELAWIYVCLGGNADALRIAKAATESMPIEKDAIAGVQFLTGLAQIDAHTSRPEEAVKILRPLLTVPAGEYVSVVRLKIAPSGIQFETIPSFKNFFLTPSRKLFISSLP